MRIVLYLVSLIWLLVLPVVAQSTDTATLIADEVAFSPDRSQLSATGNVEILQNGVRLRASAIRYDGQTDRLVVEGPISVLDADGTARLDIYDGKITGWFEEPGINDVGSDDDPYGETAPETVLNWLREGSMQKAA